MKAIEILLTCNCDDCREAIKELETLQQSLKSVMLNYDECYEKLVKAQSYIKDLEEQLKNKQENGWMNK